MLRRKGEEEWVNVLRCKVVSQRHVCVAVGKEVVLRTRVRGKGKGKRKGQCGVWARVHDARKDEGSSSKFAMWQRRQAWARQQWSNKRKGR